MGTSDPSFVCHRLTKVADDMHPGLAPQQVLFWTLRDYPTFPKIKIQLSCLFKWLLSLKDFMGVYQVVLKIQIHLIVKEQTILEYSIEWLVSDPRLVPEEDIQIFPSFPLAWMVFESYPWFHGTSNLILKLSFCLVLQGIPSDEWYVKLSYGPRWMTYIVGVGILFSSFSSCIKTLMYCVKALVQVSLIYIVDPLLNSLTLGSISSFIWY